MKGRTVAAIGDVCDPTEQRDPRNSPAGKLHYVDIAGIGDGSLIRAALSEIARAGNMTELPPVRRG